MGDKVLGLPKLKAFAGDISNVTQNIKLSYDRKHCGKRRKCWLPAFSPFPTMFSKGFFPQCVKSSHCVVMFELSMLLTECNRFQYLIDKFTHFRIEGCPFQCDYNKRICLQYIFWKWEKY